MTKKTFRFLTLTFVLSWSIVVVFRLTGLSWTTANSMIVSLLFMFMPMVSSIIIRKFVYKEKRIFPFKEIFKVNRWFFIAWLVPPLYVLASLGTSLLFPAISFSPGMESFLEQFKDVIPPEQLENLPLHPFWLALIQGLIAGVTINCIAAFGEEFGWRELLYNETASMGFWKSSLFTGAVWGIWHAPIILYGHNYPDHRVAGVFMMTLWCIMLAPAFSYIRFKSGSVLAASILHGTLNGTGGVAIMVVSGGSDLTRGITGAAGIAVLVIINLLLYPIISKEKDTWEKQFPKGTA